MTDTDTITVLDAIPFEIDRVRLRRALHVEDTPALYDEVEALAREAETAARPKAVYKLAVVEHRTDESVAIDGVAFTSRVLRVNLEGLHRVFPYVATCGMELEEWSQGLDDVMKRFWADTIKETALREALKAVGEHLTGAYRTGRRSAMSPGSLPNWPIEQQMPLFELFRGEAATIGVQLTESCLMFPVKSVSGLWFEREKDFVNCQLCPRENCPGRRAAYDPDLFEREYKGDG